METIPIRKFEKSNSPEKFNIRNLKTLLAGKDLVQEIHRHDFYFILVLEKGTGEHIIDFISYPVKDYSIFFIRPGQVHQISLGKESTGFLMEFTAEFYGPRDKLASEMIRKVTNKNYCQVDLIRSKKIHFLLEKIFDEYFEKQERYKEVIKANLEIFFIELLRQSINPTGISSIQNLYAQERLEELQELLHTNIFLHKQVPQYAEMLHLSPFQLNKITKDTVGKTCSQMINEQIILEAKRYLFTTNNQVNEIAYLLGYEDPSYFIRFFKKHTGFSPETFRTNFK